MGREATTVTVITGASSGIGRSAAQLFAARGDVLVLVARRRDELERLRDELSARGHQVAVAIADLAEAAQAQALIPQVLEEQGRIDVLVNNAGYGKQCHFEDMAPDEVARMFAVNVLSPMTLARAASTAMREQGGGSIVNVASVGGVAAHPLNVAYCASKHALVGFSKSLRLELYGTGVGVTAVCPSSTRTEFFEVARGDIPFARMVDATSVAPEKVARVIVDASTRNRAVVFPTWGAQALYLAEKWLPRLSAMGNVRYRDQVLAMARRDE